MSDTSQQSIISAMELAWRDHHHARDQTWKALQIEFIISAAVVGINWTITSVLVGLASGFLLLITTLCGVQITLRHRNRVELTKFRHIMNCEEALGLRQVGLIDSVKSPEKIKFIEAFLPKKGNTALFILRMHVAILLFSVMFIIWRVASL
jgi:hypothetical protein